eukprot:CAMPEP_0174888130 /NCGR_PEP_ID=MMETSP0167-20121228/3400_1 /TAXON_ID=38298 /ORGANISM="Rhodella maculata, Strain CCMP736" /LENGTH=52 /DNA_ID=CAMNT_0016124975 /DNA_START=342 /DNA_END=497 /DNA_ORIENTATION=-
MKSLHVGLEMMRQLKPLITLGAHMRPRCNPVRVHRPHMSVHIHAPAQLLPAQ